MCHQGQSFMEEKAEKKPKTENGNNIISSPSQESQIYSRLCQVKSPKAFCMCTEEGKFESVK